MQLATRNPQPGLFGPGTEFVATADGRLRTFHNESETTFYELPEYVYKSIKRRMGNMDACLDEVFEWAFKNLGGNDDVVDIDVNGNVSQPEYLEGYSPAYYECGKPVSEAQLRVIKSIGLETSKKIGETKFISDKTVANHLATIYQNIGCKNKAQLALWATKKGII